MKLTYHAREERLDRLVFIATEIGFGSPVGQRFDHESQRWYIVTDTGVLMVKNRACDTLITAFIATIDEAMFACEGNVPRQVRMLLAKYRQKDVYRQCELARY